MAHDKDALKRENQRLRELVVSLSVTLLRKIAAEPFRDRAPPETTVEHLMREAEKCFCCARLPGLGKDIVEDLKAAGHELMSKAVAIDGWLERSQQKK
jgi:hypothetical protein